LLSIFSGQYIVIAVRLCLVHHVCYLNIICSKMSAYFRGSNPHQADFMQQGIFCCNTLLLLLAKSLSSGRALLKLERAKLEQQAVFVAYDSLSSLS
jgi:hypothetical protein